jgi:hypothetical protein
MKIENKLGPSDFSVLADAFRDGGTDRVELLPDLDFGFVKISPLTVSRCGTGYILSTRMFFADPIGNTAFVKTGTEEYGIWKSSKKIELDLKKPVVSSEELGKDILYGLRLVERIVNYACVISDQDIYDSYIVDSKLIDMQIEKRKKQKERESRQEKLEPFEIVHAEIGYDLQIQSKDLVPLFWEYDKYDLFGGKKTYCMLPRDFASALLKCDKNALISEEQFTKDEKKVLDELVKRKHLKSRQFVGKIYYFDLDPQTRTYLIKALRTRVRGARIPE